MTKPVFLLRPGAGDPTMWREEITRRLPEYEFRVWPDWGDAAAVRFIMMFKGEPGALRQFPNLRGIMSSGAGADGILSDPALPGGVPIMRLVDDWMSIQLGQWVVHAVLHFSRSMPDYAALQAEGRWRMLTNLPQPERSVGILGCGEIGCFAAKFLAPMGFNVSGWTRSPREIGPGIRNYHGAGQLDEFLSQSDFLVCLLPLTEGTRGVLNARTLGMLPKGAVVINAARGGHIVTADLIAGINSGHLGGAFLDVTDPEPLPADHPLWTTPNVFITPHIAGMTNPRSAADQVVDNVRRIERGETPKNQVNLKAGY
jgi:glyoxylate/hydroxypyruvate reductase A